MWTRKEIETLYEYLQNKEYVVFCQKTIDCKVQVSIIDLLQSEEYWEDWEKYHGNQPLFLCPRFAFSKYDNLIKFDNYLQKDFIVMPNKEINWLNPNQVEIL
jgi:hypothetical protein